MVSLVYSARGLHPFCEGYSVDPTGDRYKAARTGSYKIIGGDTPWAQIDSTIKAYGIEALDKMSKLNIAMATLSRIEVDMSKSNKEDDVAGEADADIVRRINILDMKPGVYNE
jgi:hypothetical protein